MKVKILFILLSSVLFTANANSESLKYKNCSSINLSNTSVSSLSNVIPPEYLYSTKKYIFFTAPVVNEDERYCLIINKKNSVIVDAIPTMLRDMCGGKWDKTKDVPVWVVDVAGGRGAVDSFNYSTAQKLKKLKKLNKPEIKDIIDNINCQLSTYTKEDVQELNDSAFYLYQLGYYNESLKILNYVINLDSSRTVAYLNIADTYLALKNEDQAKKNYIIYAEKMKKLGLVSKIPNRIQKYL